MATTTNYGWTTPNDTDLVKDGAAAIRTLGSSIDTTVFANAGASIAKTIVDAKGDIIAATAADTVSRLAVGANGTVLTADSAEATGLKWASAASGQNWSLVNAGGTALSGSGTVTISGISNADSIMIILRSGSTSSASQFIRFRVNALSTSIYNYSGGELSFPSAYAASNGNTLTSFADSEILLAKTSNNAADLFSGGIILNGCNSAGAKMLNSIVATSNNSGNGGTTNLLSGFIDTTATISSIEIRVTSGTFDAGTIYVYKTA
jgi:hypothetical protein